MRSREADEGVSIAHSLTVDGLVGQGDNPGEEIIEEGGLTRAIGVMDGLEASTAVNDLLGYNHIVLSPPLYERAEGAASVTINFDIDPQAPGSDQTDVNLSQEEAEGGNERGLVADSPDSEVWRLEYEMYDEWSRDRTSSNLIVEEADMFVGTDANEELEGRNIDPMEGQSAVVRSFRCKYYGA